ncbi:MAG: cell wall metabolism sensor histidine kinase WalK, partial [Rhodospirillales bacterium]|nr:cell wall metabolism sensor histidine kinase WalK [Rhodospirillales bacterium]
MDALGKFRIAYQIAIIAVLAMLGFAVTGAVYFSGAAREAAAQAAGDAAQQRLRLAETVKFGFLNGRRHEKDFLLRQDEKYAESHKGEAKEVQAALVKLKGVADQPDLVDEVSAGFSQYESQFRALVEIWRKVGLTDESGLRGTLRKAVHEVEARVKVVDDPRLLAGMLTLRRHEKDFLLRLDAKYLQSLESDAESFVKTLEGSALPAADKAQIGELLAAYRRDFRSMAEARLKAVAEATRLSEVYAQAEPKLDRLAAAAIAQDEQASGQSVEMRSSVSTRITATLIAVPLTVLALALLIGHGISGPIHQMTEVMGRLAHG